MACTCHMLASLSEVMHCMERAHPWDISGAKITGKMRHGPRRRKGRDCAPLNSCVDVILPFSVRGCGKHPD